MILIEIIGLAMIGHMGAEVFSHFDWMPDKPMKCNMCLTFWLGVGPLILEHGWLGLAMAGCASLASELIYKLLIRL